MCSRDSSECKSRLYETQAWAEGLKVCKMRDEECALYLRAFGRDGQADEVAFRSQSY